MARVVRKVETKGGRKRRLKSSFGFLRKKLFWIIVAAVLLVAAGITAGIIIYNNLNKTKEVYVEDYFAQTYKSKDGEDVTFTKASYAQVKLHTYQDAEIVVEHIFVFAADLSTFYPKELMDDTDGDGDYDDDLKVKTHETVFNSLIELQAIIDAYNKNATDKKAALYIVDTGNTQENKTGNGHDKNFANNNSLIYSDSSFVYISSSDDEDEETITGPLFSYHNASEGLIRAFSGYKGEEYIEYDKDNSSKVGLSLYGVNDYNELITPISNSAKYINLGFENETENVVDEDYTFEFGNNGDYSEVSLEYGDQSYKNNGITITALADGSSFKSNEVGHAVTAGIEVRFVVVRGAKVVIETENGNFKYNATKTGVTGSKKVELELSVKTTIVLNFTGEDTLKSITVTY